MLTQSNYPWIETGKWHVKLFLCLTFFENIFMITAQNQREDMNQAFPTILRWFDHKLGFLFWFPLCLKVCLKFSKSFLLRQHLAFTCINKALNKLICIVCYKPETLKRLCYFNSTAESQFIIYLKKQKPHCREMCFVSGFHKKGFLLL